MDLKLAEMPLRAAIFISMLSAWVLVGLFQYLNRYTNRRYFAIWTGGWLFYTLFLTVSFTMGTSPSPALLMAKNWCIATAAVMMLWGSFRFLNLPANQRLIAVTLLFVTMWSYAASVQFPGALWITIPAFGLLAFTSGFTSCCFFQLRQSRCYLGAGLLTFGFALWALYLFGYPFLQAQESLLSMGFLISGVLQLFVAVSMIVLVLEEAKANMHRAEEQIREHQGTARFFRARAEKTEQSFEHLFENAGDAIVIVSPKNLEILRMNQAAKRLFRLPEGTPASRALREFCAIPCPSNSENDPSAWLKNLCESPECDVTRHDGSKVRVQIRGGAISRDGGEVYQFFLVELTQRAKLEQQLRQAEKLSALGQMLSGVAHELNNPLTVIKGYADLILLTGSMDEQTRSSLIKVAQESNRASKLVHNLLAFARPEYGEYAPVKINQMLREISADRAARANERGVSIHLDLSEEEPMIFGSEDQLQQVLINLINNAEHAMAGLPGPRRITIRSHVLNDKVQLRVEDRGPGIPDDILPRIFEPFFTTKSVGEGTGLGLSICYSIVLNHKGRIYYERAESGGACFTIELPLLETEAPDSGSAPIETPNFNSTLAPTDRLDVLVVDDEPTLRALLKDMLELLGHDVTIAESGPRALELMADSRFDLIISDFRMPGMTGGEIYQRAMELHPELKGRFLFVTGDMVNPETRQFFERSSAPFVLKPFHLSTIESAIANLCRATPKAAVA